MMTLASWRTDDPCPGCGTTLTVADDGGALLRAECRACGWSDTWTTDEAGGDE